jgi:hypothetical protein
MPDERTGPIGYHSDVMSAVIQASTCACGAPDCVFRPGHLVPLRDHIARLYHTIGLANYERCLQDCSDHSWLAVTYHLQMAGSIEDLTADTGYVDLTSSIMMCRPAREYEARHSALASTYTAALAIFNFLWVAYEGAIKAGASTFLPRASTTIRGRELMKRPSLDALRPAVLSSQPSSSASSAIISHMAAIRRRNRTCPATNGARSGSIRSRASCCFSFSSSPPKPSSPGDPHYDHPDEDDEYEGHQRSLREVLLSLQFEACAV